MCMALSAYCTRVHFVVAIFPFNRNILIDLLTFRCSSLWLKLLTSLILYILYTLLCIMYLFNTLNDWCCKHFVAITSTLLCIINKCVFDIQMCLWYSNVFFSTIFMLIKHINACFNIVSTMTVPCLCVRLSGYSCPDYNSCFEALS